MAKDSDSEIAATAELACGLLRPYNAQVPIACALRRAPTLLPHSRKIDGKHSVELHDSPVVEHPDRQAGSRRAVARPADIPRAVPAAVDFPASGSPRSHSGANQGNRRFPERPAQ